MDYKVLIFTQYEKIESLLGGISASQKKLALIKSNNLTGYVQSEDSFGSTSPETEIFLLKDDISEDEIKFLLKTFSNHQKLIVLYHNKTIVKDRLEEIFKDVYFKSMQGNHINGDKHHYEPIFNILLSDVDNKTQLILEHFDIDGDFLRSHKLQFLNRIYDGHTNIEIPAKLKGKFNEGLYEPLKNYSYNKHLDRPAGEAYQNSTEKEKNKHNEAREALKELRDAILKIS